MITLSYKNILNLLKANSSETKQLHQKANAINQVHHQKKIYLRGIIEFSNHCIKDCLYCGIRHQNQKVKRYRISVSEILKTCHQIENAGVQTVVLQSGDDPYYTKEKIGELINEIKSQTNLAITLSIGERSNHELTYWRELGFDRFLLRFETSNSELFNQIHPDKNLEDRLSQLRFMQSQGIQTGSGFLIGIPGQTLEELAKDILFCTDLNLDMIGCGPFVPSINTPFEKQHNSFSKDIYYKTISILRILNPYAHIPATTAFDAIDKDGRARLLQMGCNVLMPNFTPQKYKIGYQLYNNKPGINDTSAESVEKIKEKIFSLNLEIGSGHGHSILKV